MRGVGLILVIIGVLAMGFVIGKCTNKSDVKEIVLPDTSRNADKIDSLEFLIKADSVIIKGLQITIDSLKAKKTNNHKKLNNDIKTVKGFSRAKRDKFLDSIYGANKK